MAAILAANQGKTPWTNLTEPIDYLVFLLNWCKFTVYVNHSHGVAMHYTLGEASKITGVSKTAIAKAILRQNNKLSAEKGENGEWKIEASELDRVFKITGSLQEPSPRKVDEQKSNVYTELTPELKAKDETIASLKAHVDFLQGQMRNFERLLAAPDTIRQEARQERERLQTSADTERARLLTITDRLRDDLETARLDAQKATIDRDAWKRDAASLKAKLDTKKSIWQRLLGK